MKFFFKYSNQKSKKIKITFLMDKAVATDSEGVLSLDDDLETDFQEMTFNIPIFNLIFTPLVFLSLPHCSAEF